MIRLYRAGRGTCEPIDDLSGFALGDDVVWIDLSAPSREEEQAVERALGVQVPTREEMAEIEVSSRLNRDGKTTFLTADLLSHGDAQTPVLEPVTFILTGGPLVTVRYSDPKPFAMLADKLERSPDICGAGWSVFLNLMEVVVDRVADILEADAARVEAIADHIFAEGKTIGFDKLITKLGRAQIATARIDQSLTGLARIFAFVALDDRIEHSAEAREHLRSLGRDVQSLSAHAQGVSAHINFQLSAALGLINIEQSSIIKIFSVAAVAFMPPTLIASIYGMNFRHMPELPQPWGYPAALAAMVVAAILPLLWFKKKGWL